LGTVFTRSSLSPSASWIFCLANFWSVYPSLRYLSVYHQDSGVFLPATVLNYITSRHLNIECSHFNCIPRSTWIVRSLHWSVCLYVNWIIQEVTLLKCVPRGNWLARPVYWSADLCIHVSMLCGPFYWSMYL
jgi:hypothetical protein